jgi:hypothetical protein
VSTPKGLYNLTAARLYNHHLKLAAEVDDEGVGRRLHLDPVALVGDLEAGDHAREEQGEEVPVAVGRQAERRARVRARRVVVDVEDHVAAADVPLQVVVPESQTLAQQPQYLHPHASRLHGEPLDNLPIMSHTKSDEGREFKITFRQLLCLIDNELAIPHRSLRGFSGQSMALSPAGKEQARRRQSRQYLSPPVSNMVLE